MNKNRKVRSNTIFMTVDIDDERLKINRSLVNNIEDSIWYFEDEINQKKGTINWDLTKIPYRYLQSAKEFIYAEFNEGIPEGVIYCRPRALAQSLRLLRKIFSNLDKLETKPKLQSLDYKGIKSLAQKMIIKPDGSIYSRGTAEQFCAFILKSHNFYNEGKTNDGIIAELPVNLQADLFKKIANSNGLDYEQWIKGGKLNTISAQTAIQFMSYIIKTLESDKTNFLRAFFRFQRSENAIDSKHLFPETIPSIMHHLLIDRSKNSSAEEKEVALYHLNGFIYKRRMSEIGDKLIKLATLFEEFGITRMLGPKEIHGWAYDRIKLCIAGITLLTGARISEIASLKPDAIKQNQSAGYTFTSKIHKTHRGHEYTRSVTGYVSELLDICLDLSYIDKNKTGISPFAKTITQSFAPPRYGKNTLVPTGSKKTLAGNVSEAYNQWHKTLSNVEKQKHSGTASPHSLRHAFAELALRRFDGQVNEKIRQHFMHTYGSSHTKRYVEEKIETDVQAKAEKSYIKDIVRTIYEDHEHEYYGPVVKTIVDKINSSYDIVPPAEAERIIEEISGEFSTLTPHEYGYCMVSKSALAQAQCIDKETGLVNTLEQSSVKNCTKCVHRLTHKFQKETLINIGISHQSFIDESPLPHITNASKTILKQIKAVLSEME